MRRWLRVGRLAFLDAVDVLTGRRPPLTPSRVLIDRVGLGDFRAVGEHLAQWAIRFGELKPEGALLDAGCGIGRLAAPLTSYLTTGSYLGFDVSKTAIDWCNKHIASKYPNFSFVTVDVFSRHYNAGGTVQPEAFRFPSDDARFDVAVLASILTHLTPGAAAQYVAETARVLKPGGRVVASFFLFDDAIRARMAARQVVPSFVPAAEPFWAVINPDDPEAAVAYDIDVVRNAFRDRGLEVVDIHRGVWSGHADGVSYQDVVVARRA